MVSRFRTQAASVLLAIFASACSADPSTAAGEGGGDAALQKKQQPAAPIGALPLNVETIAEGLANPWSLAFLPNGDILVTERPGRLRIIRDGALLESAVAGTPPTLDRNQAGFFDILPHPDFAANNVVYLAYASGPFEENALRIARANLVNDALENLEVIYEAKPLKDTGHHYGGRMIWGPDGKLYVTIGEGSKYKELAQDMASSFGSVIRLNEDGTVPDDNPDFGDGALPELFTKGHRNGQGLAYDPVTGIMWEHEHGAKGGDEVNIIEAGNNYGWPKATFGTDYNGSRITPFTEYAGTAQPVKFWTPSIAPSGLAVYRGDLFADWNGDLLVGALSIPDGRALHRVIMDGATPIGEERYLVDLEYRIREVRVAPDGSIYVTTEDRGGSPVGKVLRLTPKS